MKYRVYEAVNNDGNTFKEHGEFLKLKDAQHYAMIHHNKKSRSTFVINYNMDTSVAEQYYGDWSN